MSPLSGLPWESPFRMRKFVYIPIIPLLVTNFCQSLVENETGLSLWWHKYQLRLKTLKSLNILVRVRWLSFNLLGTYKNFVRVKFAKKCFKFCYDLRILSRWTVINNELKERGISFFQEFFSKSTIKLFRWSTLWCRIPSSGNITW